MEALLQYVQDEFVPKKELPSFQAGDTITVYYEIREGAKVRTQFFKGVVIQIKGSGATKTFTILEFQFARVWKGIFLSRFLP